MPQDLHAHCISNADQPEPLTFFPNSAPADALCSAVTDGLKRLFEAMADGRDQEVGSALVDELIARIMAQPTPADRYEAMEATLTFLLADTCGVLMAADNFIALHLGRGQPVAASNN